MGLEIELKFRVMDHDQVVSGLVRLGFAFKGAVVEEDEYLNAPDRDFAKTGEAFRLRREGNSQLLTYKGPRLPGKAKVRKEIELTVCDSLDDLSRLLELFLALGYSPVAKVSKKRMIHRGDWHGAEVTVCLDTIEGIGCFVELEQLAEESMVDEVSVRLANLAEELGLSEPEPRSYLGLVLRNAQGKS